MSKLIEIGKVAPPKQVTITLSEKEAHYIAVFMGYILRERSKLDEETMLFRYRINMMGGQNPPAELLDHWRDNARLAEGIIDKIATADQ
jgi:hypothetical protein